jgi:hypothetical protein
MFAMFIIIVGDERPVLPQIPLYFVLIVLINLS